MTGASEHVEARVTGRQEAVDVVLRLLRAGGPGITGGGARGPYERDGRVGYYAHLQVDVAAAAAAAGHGDLGAALAAAYTPEERRGLADYITVGLDTLHPLAPLLRRLRDALEETAPARVLPRCPVEVPESQRPRIIEESGVPAGEADWRCYLAPHRADRHTVRPREGGHMFPFTAEQPPGPPPLPAPRGSLAAELLVHYGARSPCKTRVCRRLPVPGLLVCCIPCRSAPDGRHGPHTEVCDRRHIESLGAEAVKAGE